MSIEKIVVTQDHRNGKYHDQHFERSTKSCLNCGAKTVWEREDDPYDDDNWCLCVTCGHYFYGYGPFPIDPPGSESWEEKSLRVIRAHLNML